MVTIGQQYEVECKDALYYMVITTMVSNTGINMRRQRVVQLLVVCVTYKPGDIGSRLASVV